MGRRGITPVVAVALLMGMTVAASGGAYTWVSQVQEQAQEDASRAATTRLDVKDVRCDRGAVELSIKNGGNMDIDTASADLFVYGPGDDLAASRSNVDLSDLSLGPGAFISPSFVVPAVLEPGSRYRVELVFERDGASAEATCDPRTADLDPVALWTFDDEPGHRPVIIYDDTPQLYHLENFGNGSFGALQAFGASYGHENDGGVVMADLDRNGVQDIMFYGENHNIYVWHDITDGPPAGAPVKVATLGGAKAQGMTAGDWDADGDLDVIENRDGDLIENLGNGSWTTSSLSFSGDRDVVSGDFDGDGCEDVVYGAGNEVVFRPGQCDGTFGAGTTVLGSPGDDNWLAAGDFDGDGNQDFVLVDEGDDGYPDLYTGDGDGTFTLAAENFSAPGGSSDHHNPVASDLDGDGDLDLILAEHNDDAVWYVPGNGDGTFGSAVKIADTPSNALGSAAPGSGYVRDRAGTNHARRLGSPDWTVGRAGDGLQFDGVGDFVTAPHSAALSREGNITISGWLKMDPGTGGDKHTLVQKEGNYGVLIDAVPRVFLELWDEEGDRVKFYSEDLDSFVGDWIQVTYTVAENSHVSLHINGTERKRWTIGHGITDTADGPLRIGKRASDIYFTDGTIDEIAVYPGALH